MLIYPSVTALSDWLETSNEMGLEFENNVFSLSRIPNVNRLIAFNQY